MTNIMKKTLAHIVLLLATGSAFSQVPLLKTPAAVPHATPVIKQAQIKNPIPVVNAASIASSSPNREEAARRLKAQSVSVATAIGAIRGAFGSEVRLEGRALLAAGYATPDVLVAIKQVDGLDAISMAQRMALIGIALREAVPELRRLYNLDFDALLSTVNRAYPERMTFGYAMGAMGYNLEQSLQAGHRYFVGGFESGARGNNPFPGAGDMYRMVAVEAPLAEVLRVDHFALFVRMMEAGYQPADMFREVPMGTSNATGSGDSVTSCLVRSGFSYINVSNTNSVNPKLLIEVSPGGQVSHSEAHRGCVVDFLGKLRTNRATRAFATGMANAGVSCAPVNNSACAGEISRVVEMIVSEAGYPSEKR